VQNLPLTVSCHKEIRKKVEFVSSKRGQKKVVVRFFFGRIRDLDWDPSRFRWSDHQGILDYSTQQGRSLLRACYNTPDLAATRWNLILPPRFQFAWGDAWTSERARKEAMLIWQLWHKAVAVNVWRGKISNQVDKCCPMCSTNEDETVLHRFWSCEDSQQLWTFSTNLLNRLAEPRRAAVLSSGPSRTGPKCCLPARFLANLSLWHVSGSLFVESPSGVYGSCGITLCLLSRLGTMSMLRI
jgi:hypothetical protein